MKKLFILLSLWGAVLTAQAQRTVESINKEYQNAVEYFAMMSDSFPGEGIPPEYYHLHVSHNLPGTGVHTEDIRMHYNEIEPEEDEDHYVIYLPHYLRYATTKFNYAAREFYEEYFYDEKGQVMFIYAITPDVGEWVTPYELRLWFDGERLLRFQAKKYDGQPDYLDIEYLRNGKFKETYSGTTIPEMYQDEVKRCQSHAQGILTMFKHIEDCTYITDANY